MTPLGLCKPCIAASGAWATPGRGGYGGGVGRGAVRRRPQAVSARQPCGRGGTAQGETRRKSVACGPARAPRGAAQGHSAGTRRGAGGPARGPGGLRRADVVGLPCGAERGFSAVLCRGCSWGCVRVQHVTVLRGAAPRRCTAPPPGAVYPKGEWAVAGGAGGARSSS